MTDIVLVNRTPRIRDARFAALLPALQAQLDEDFCPAWHLPPARLHLVGHAGTPAAAHWKIWLLGTSDQPGTLGYHEADPGIPEAKVFVEDDLRFGAEISVTISHELLEMMADPYVNQFGPSIAGATYMREVCDAVEADGDGYLKFARKLVKAGFLMSNFVLPSYYQSRAAGPGPWDFRGLLTGPCPALRPGGYALYLKDGTYHTIAARYEDGSLSHRASRPFGRSAQRAAQGASP